MPTVTVPPGAHDISVSETCPGAVNILVCQWIIKVKITPLLLKTHLSLLTTFRRVLCKAWLDQPPTSPDHPFSPVAYASNWISRCSERVKLALGIASFCYANSAQPATSLVAVFVALRWFPAGILGTNAARLSRIGVMNHLLHHAARPFSRY